MADIAIGKAKKGKKIPQLIRTAVLVILKDCNYLTVVISEPNHFVEISPSFPSAFISLKML